MHKYPAEYHHMGNYIDNSGVGLFNYIPSPEQIIRGGVYLWPDILIWMQC